MKISPRFVGMRRIYFKVYFAGEMFIKKIASRVIDM